MPESSSASPILVVDLEATCAADGSLPRDETEIIEIGAVMADGTTYAVFDEFQAFVRPVRHPRLTPFCTQLTGISQQEVDAAELFPAVMNRFAAWFRQHGDVRFFSWGDYDRNQLAHDCAVCGIENPMPVEHRNLKKAFQQKYGLRRGVGMAEALQKAGLTLAGRHHRGIDDARNIARLLPFAFRTT